MLKSGSKSLEKPKNFVMTSEDIAKAVTDDKHENGAKHTKMASWNIQNVVIACLAEFIMKRIKEYILEYYVIIADEFTNRFSNKEIFAAMLTLCNLPKWFFY